MELKDQRRTIHLRVHFHYRQSATRSDQKPSKADSEAIRKEIILLRARNRQMIFQGEKLQIPKSQLKF